MTLANLAQIILMVVGISLAYAIPMAAAYAYVKYRNGRK